MNCVICGRPSNFLLDDICPDCEAICWAEMLQTVRRPGDDGYDPDCPLCLEGFWHTDYEHADAIHRSRESVAVFEVQE